MHLDSFQLTPPLNTEKASDNPLMAGTVPRANIVSWN
jgi:hypothetical protein